MTGLQPRTVAVAALMLLAACASPTPAPSAPESTPAGLGEAGEMGCSTIRLRGPNGDPVNLTGVWAGAEDTEPIYNVRQIGDCFFLALISTGEPPGYYDSMCDGRIAVDLVITVNCVDFLRFRSDPRMGREYFLIQFAADGTIDLVHCLEPDEPATCDDPLVPWTEPS